MNLSAFSGCTSLDIPNYSNVFNGCVRLASLQIPTKISEVWDDLATTVKTKGGIVDTDSEQTSNVCTGTGDGGEGEYYYLTNNVYIGPFTDYAGTSLKIESNYILPAALKGYDKQIKDLTVKQLLQVNNSTSEKIYIKLAEIFDTIEPNTVLETFISSSSLCNNALEGCVNLKELSISTLHNNQTLGALFGCKYFGKQPNGETYSYFAEQIATAGDLKYGLNYCVPESLTKVHLTGQTGILPAYAFANMSKLETITIPNGVTTIDDYAFFNCSGLTSITIPESVTSIGDYAFYNCSSLTSVTIPESVTNIGAYAFYGCTGLTSITIPNSVTNIGTSAFDSCMSLAEIQFDSMPITRAIKAGTKVTEPQIGNYAFKSCPITALSIPDRFRIIGKGVLNGCSRLTNLIVPFVGNRADAENATATTLFGYIFGEEPYTDGVKTIQQYSDVTPNNTITYYLPTSLTGVTVTSGKLYYGAFSNCIYIQTISLGACYGAIEEFDIEKFAFYNCANLMNIFIPREVIAAPNAFNGCAFQTANLPLSALPNSEQDWSVARLTNIVINGGYTFNENNERVEVNVLDNSYLAKASLLRSLIVGPGVKEICAYAFYGCGSLEFVSFEKDIETIGYSAFLDCSKIVSVNIEDVAGWCNISFANAFANPLYYASTLCVNSTVISDLEIPNGVTNIPLYAFSASNIVRVSIPSSVQTFEEAAFDGSEITSVYTEKGIAAWCAAEFKSTRANPLYQGAILLIKSGESYTPVTNLTEESNIHRLNSYALNGCTSITTVDLKNVEVVGSYVFMDCTGLTAVNLTGDKLESIGHSVFDGCVNLRTLSLSHSIKSIGKNILQNCTKLTKLEIPFIGSTPYYTNTVIFNCPANYHETTSVIEDSAYIGEELYKQEAYDQTTFMFITYENTSHCSSAYSYPDISAPTEFRLSYLAGDNLQLTSLTYLNLNATELDATKDDCNSDHGGYYLAYETLRDFPALETLIIGNRYTSIAPYLLQNATKLKNLTLPTNVLITDSISMGYTVNEDVPVAVYKQCYEGEVCGGTLYDHIENGLYGHWEDLGYYYLTLATTFVDAPVYSRSYMSLLSLFGTTLRTNMVECKNAKGTLSSGTLNGNEDTPPDVDFNFGSISTTEFSYSTTYYMPSQLKVALSTSSPYNPGEFFRSAVGVTEVVLPEGITKIDDSYFYGCTNLTKVIIPDTVTEIGANAFYGCDNLISIIIPDSVKTIGRRAFAQCSNLTSITIGRGVKTVGDDAFVDCNKLVEVVNHSTLDFVVGETTYGKIAYSAIEVHNDPDSNIETWDNYLFYSYNNTNYLVNYIGNLTKLTLPDTLTYRIYNHAFRNSSLTEVIIPANVTSIGNYAFYGCGSLTKAEIGTGVTSIGDYAFYNCYSLCSRSEAPTLPTNLEHIGERAFYNCRFNAITIPENVYYIGLSAFYQCSSLTSAIFKTTQGWKRCSSTTQYCYTLSETALSNVSQAATYLKSTYHNYIWQRTTS